jgi:hypothetical protein
MASSGKQKTTMAKLSREAKLRERQAEKAAKKERRKQPGFESQEDTRRLVIRPGAEL